MDRVEERGDVAHPGLATRRHAEITAPFSSVSALLNPASGLRLQQSAGNRAMASYLAVNRFTIQRCGSVPVDRCPCHDEPQPSVQRSVKDNSGPGLCGGVRTCAASSGCDVPDRPGSTPGAAPQLTIAIDIEAASPDAVDSDHVGHTYVELRGPDGAMWTFGFYPVPGASFHPLRTTSAGCMVHPDTIHERCVDYRETFTLTQPQFDAALSLSQSLCRTPPAYDLQTFNCTTFASRIATAAGKSLPTIRGRVGSGVVSGVADNPNTLIEGLRDRDVPTRHLSGDTEMRDWVNGHSPADIAHLPEQEKIRMINRLLDGWVADEDINAIERIFNGVPDRAQADRIDGAVRPRSNDLNFRQRQRLRILLDRRP
jgi:hypothetical protein